VFDRYGDPDMMERAIPILYSAVKERDPSQSDSNEDILNFLGQIARQNRGQRSQIRVYLALALVTNNQHSREDYLREFALISTGKNTRDEAKRIVASIARTAKDDPVLVRILDSAAKNLDGGIQNAANITER
jgi:predicted NBD/HSP70 family sugar kinase